ncbi:MAG: DUF116 domain-containing protein [Bacillota bacterium]|jgi:hypothetical protein|nr:DUF116 domain-containing protein [Bacillota bacterium]HHU29485.1 DUF116 domain-containing protein [Bacillota bacterium]
MIKKRLFLGLSAISLLLLAAGAVYIWLTFFDREALVLRYITAILVFLAVVILTMVFLGFALIILSLLSDKDVSVFSKPVNLAFSLLYPVVIWVGKIFQITQDKIQRSFVEVNNQLIRTKKMKILPHKLLLLLPHCLQVADCGRRITADTANCIRCGRCPVGKILDLCDRYGIHVRIATGGTVARSAVKKLQPQAIVAVACERDLTSGILDCIPLPVLGVLNERPNGPCFNTSVNINAVEKALLYFLEGGEKNVASGFSA